MKGGCGRVRRVSTQSVLLYLLLCYSETRGGGGGGGLLHNASQLQKPETLSIFLLMHGEVGRFTNTPDRTQLQT